MGKLEEDYEDVLQNLEFALVSVYREDNEMTDWQALNAINGLIRTYTAETRKRTPPNLSLNEQAQLAYDRVKAMCDLRLGRSIRETADGLPLPMPGKPLSVDEILQCLKRIRRSIELWNKELGRRGYFDFAGKFLP